MYAVVHGVHVSSFGYRRFPTEGAVSLG